MIDDMRFLLSKSNSALLPLRWNSEMTQRNRSHQGSQVHEKGMILNTLFRYGITRLHPMVDLY